jgi:hypothetical protein
MMKKLFLVPVVAIALLASCSKTLPQPEQISVNPSPLAVVGNKVNAEITGTFPQKKFAKKGTLVVTPVLKFDGQEVLGTPATYIGQKVKDNGTVVKYKEGGKYKQNVSFDYVPAMNESELYLRFTANIKGKTIEIPDVKIADGVMATAKLAKAQDNQTVLTADKFQRVIQQMQEADIKFLIQQSNLRESETSSKAVKDFQAAIKDASKDPKKSISKLEISGYASPEGGLELNTKLAEARQANAQKFIANKMQADNVNAKIQSSTTAEDWNGFQAAMENSNIQDKELVLRVLSMYSDPEEREAQIKNLSNVYKNIADEILPALRRSRMILTTDIIGKTDEEIKAMVAEDASKLNIEEMLYAATLTNDNAEKAAIYQKAAEMYNDYRAYNNLGMVYYSKATFRKPVVHLPKHLR